MPLTSKEMIKLLEGCGFVSVSQSGSHRKMRNLDTGKVKQVLMHNSDLKKGMKHTILKQAGLK